MNPGSYFSCCLSAFYGFPITAKTNIGMDKAMVCSSKELTIEQTIKTMNPVRPNNTTNNVQIEAIKLTLHARKRMNARSLGIRAINAALDFGRIVRTRGAVIYAIGHKEVQRYRKVAGDLHRFEGVHVVCSPEGTVLTTYRNHDFKNLRA